jgi:hypothetical protein
MLADNPSPTGTHGVLSTLLTWHQAHPPTDYERTRNNLIYSGVSISGITRGQGNRNPFIDFPQFADAIFLDATRTSFSKWQTQRFTLAQLQNAALSGPNGDLDGDGRSNYFEFLFGGNPTAGNEESLTVTRTGNQITLTFYRPKGVTEQARIESMTAAFGSSWQTVLDWQSSSTITDLGDYERIEFSTPIPVGAGGLLYRVVSE